jgi:hypothetical protein
MEGMEKQTAVEWFAKRISHGGLVSKKQFNELLEQAKQIDKQEQQKLGIILAAFAEEIGDKKFTELLIKAEQYYKETFKSE